MGIFLGGKLIIPPSFFTVFSLLMRMILKSIEFNEKFLLHEHPERFKFKFNPNLQFITGPNGYGKTTIIELIYQMIYKDDLDDVLKERIGRVILNTSQGPIIYDSVNGLQKDKLINFCKPQIRYKKQENNGYSITEEDVQLIINNQSILGMLIDYLGSKLEPVFDLNTGNIFLQNVNTKSTLSLEDAPVSLQNLLMMYIFAIQTQKGDIFLLEHPEEHLHLAFQRDIMVRLNQLCRGQMIVTTHSSSIFGSIGTTDLYVISKKDDNNVK